MMYLANFPAPGWGLDFLLLPFLVSRPLPRPGKLAGYQDKLPCPGRGLFFS